MCQWPSLQECGTPFACKSSRWPCENAIDSRLSERFSYARCSRVSRKAQYDAAVADAQGAHVKLAASEQAREAEEADLRRQLADGQQTSHGLAQKVSDLSTANHNLQARLNESTAIGAQLRASSRGSGRMSTRCFKKRGHSPRRWRTPRPASRSCEECRQRPTRTQLFKQFLRKLKSMIDAGQLRVVMRAGRLVIQLPNDVLFDSGQKSLKTAGKHPQAFRHALALARRRGRWTRP
jgi:chemotaxis protein MotB